MNYTNKMFEGKKTYVSIAIALVGYFGLAQYITEAETASLISSVLELVGLVGAIYGRYVAKV